MEFKGNDGEICFSNGIITIKKGKRGVPRTIDISNVVTVTLLKPGLLVASGCIYVQVIGGKQYSNYLNATHYAGDLNAILFKGKKKTEEAIKFKEEIDKFISDARQNLTAELKPVNDNYGGG